MAFSEIIAKQVTVLKADASQYKAEMKSAGLADDKRVKDSIAGMERQNQALERAGQKFGLYAAAGAAAYTLISAGVKKYEEHLKSLGSRGESELAKLQGMTKKLNDVQDSLLITLGKLAVAAEPVVSEFAKMAQELAGIAAGVAAVVQAAKNLPGAGYVGTGLGKAVRYGLPGYGQALAVKDAYGYFANDETVAPGGALSRLASMGEFGMMNAEDNWRQWVRDRLTPAEQAAPGATPPSRRRGGGRRGSTTDPYADAAASIFGDIAATSGYSSGRYSQADLDEVFGTGEAPVGSSMGWEGIGIPQSVFDNLKRVQDELVSEQRQSILEGIFGPVEEFDAYQTAWTGLEAVVTAGFDAWIDGSKSVGAAMKEALHGFAKNLAGEALLQALRHGAYALGSLAFGDMKGAAAHGVSAAKWGAVAVAAGVIGKVTAPSQGAGASSNSYAAAGIGGGVASAGRNDNASLTVVMGDGFADDSPRYRARRVRRAINQARGYYPESGATEAG